MTNLDIIRLRKMLRKEDKSNVIECGRYEPTEEWTQIMMELKSVINSYNARK